MTGDLQDHTLLTSGIRSPVYTQKGRRKSGIGHVSLLDWDDHVTPSQAKEMLREERLSGVTLIFMSSDGNYHGWNLSVRTFRQVSELLQQFEDDGKHRSIGESRGWWRLRCGPKYNINHGETYKHHPELVDVFYGSNTYPQSMPHLRVADAIADLPGDVEDPYDWEGDTCQISQYVTYTDTEKHVHRQMERVGE